MELEPADVQQIPAVAAFIAELRHCREVSGCSRKKGTVRITTFDRGMARLVCHEVDHQGTGQRWTYQ